MKIFGAGKQALRGETWKAESDHFTCTPYNPGFRQQSNIKIEKAIS